MTTPTAKNRKLNASAAAGSQSKPVPRDSRPSDPAEFFERGIAARLRGLGMGVRAEPLKEVRLQVGLDVQLIYFTIRMPVAGGVKVRWPVMATFAPRLYSPTRPQHVSGQAHPRQP
ncbi:hypothetical protein [Mycobacterium sp. 94-17]|uniref:hypothetical protein n=1 Tax=Mycobacterium sp. 94-17 TaxID=2986147 RepID=UPI002D1E50AF|nr:hypothetical protein [Mycobacterium sp. 94-17]MEB4208901.1 hypothetical protein [Mycobacterium sp. 94-17]